MNLIEARTITARVAKQCRGLGRVGALVDELARFDGQDNATMAGDTVRTLDDLAGHYEDSRFIGGRTIAAALRMCRAFPVASCVASATSAPDGDYFDPGWTCDKCGHDNAEGTEECAGEKCKRFAEWAAAQPQEGE